jgi:hypothetical protein
MNILRSWSQFSAVLALVLMLSLTTACVAVAPPSTQVSLPSSTTLSTTYGQLARGNSAKGQNFGDWVVEASKGLVKDAFVRDNNKLGVVISPLVRPNELKDLAKSLTQGFHKNFPNQDLRVMMYAPDKKLILTTLYDAQSKQVEFQQAS